MTYFNVRKTVTEGDQSVETEITIDEAEIFPFELCDAVLVLMGLRPAGTHTSDDSVTHGEADKPSDDPGVNREAEFLYRKGAMGAAYVTLVKAGDAAGISWEQFNQPPPKDTQDYKAHKDFVAKMFYESAFRRRNEIAPLPKVADLERRELCKRSLAAFATVYFPQECSQPFTPYQWNLIRQFERSLHASAPLHVSQGERGCGDTTLLLIGTVWAIATGFAKYPVYITHSHDSARHVIHWLRLAFETSPLADDFPEIGHAFRSLGGVGMRAKSQTFNGEPTRVATHPLSIELPITAPAVGVDATPVITRPFSHRMIRGKRPDFVVCDSPLSAERAASMTHAESWDNTLRCMRDEHIRGIVTDKRG